MKLRQILLEELFFDDNGVYDSEMRNIPLAITKPNPNDSSQLVINITQEGYDYIDAGGDIESILRVTLGTAVHQIRRRGYIGPKRLFKSIFIANEDQSYIKPALDSLIHQGHLKPNQDGSYSIANGTAKQSDYYNAPGLVLRHIRKHGLEHNAPGVLAKDLYAATRKHGPNQIIISRFEDALYSPFTIRSGKSPDLANKSAEHPEASTILTSAVGLHSKWFHGKRWPALEYAFLQRENTYQGLSGDFIRPRTSILKYLYNINDTWPEGHRLIRNFVDKITIDDDEANVRRFRFGFGKLTRLLNDAYFIAYLERFQPESLQRIDKPVLTIMNAHGGAEGAVGQMLARRAPRYFNSLRSRNLLNN